jgi:hypothetical protein
MALGATTRNIAGCAVTIAPPDRIGLADSCASPRTRDRSDSDALGRCSTWSILCRWLKILADSVAITSARDSVAAGMIDSVAANPRAASNPANRQFYFATTSSIYQPSMQEGRKTCTLV